MTKEKRVDWRLWRELMRHMLRFKKHLTGLMITMLFTAGIDVLYPLLSKYAIDVIIPAGDTSKLPAYFIVYAVFALAQGLNVILFIRFASRIELGMAKNMREELFLKLQQLSLSYYDDMPIGQITSRMLSDVTRISEMLAWSIVDGSWALVYMIGVVVAMLILNPFLALIVLLSVPPVVILSIYFQRKVLHAQRRVRKINAVILGLFNEGIMGAQTTKTLQFEDENLSQFRKQTHEMKQAAQTAARYSGIYLPIIMLVGNICMASVLWGGGRMVMIGGISLGVLATFVSYASGFFEPVNNIAGILIELQAAQAAGERVLELIHLEPKIRDTEEVKEIYGDVFSPKKENWPKMQGHVTFDHVTFGYHEDHPVLEDFSLDVLPGTQVALVGETGAGKTTIAQLLGRFYEPTKGEVRIDGQDTRTMGQLFLHRNMGYVLQVPHLFSGTVRDNIRYGRPDATDEETEEAAKTAYAHDFIMQLKDGYETQVGEGGNLLSTGQKQLIAFARAILIDPAVFILDEATASIDTKTEQLIQKAIDKVLQGRTSFVIAHRLSTIRRADLIIVIRNGREIERGTHRELMKKRDAYFELYQNQFEEQSQRAIVGKEIYEE
ncbi:MAG: ABC transporter ATP-binding protein [Clostridia bacterium]|nr:ABC transporter ATP-binding protein [Clostridia bacterium]